MSNNEHWHLRKELSIGTLISLALMAVGGVAAFVRVEASLEHKAGSMEVAVVQEQTMNLKEDIQEIKQDIKEILRKLQERPSP